jgi:hypothetical protein
MRVTWQLGGTGAPILITELLEGFTRTSADEHSIRHDKLSLEILLTPVLIHVAGGDVTVAGIVIQLATE